MRKIVFRLAVSAAIIACVLLANSRAKVVLAALSGYQ